VGYRPHANWSGEIERTAPPASTLIGYCDVGDGTETQVFEIPLDVPAGQKLIVKIGDQIVFASPAARLAGMEETTEPKREAIR
jgi:hypothetical protein